MNIKILAFLLISIAAASQTPNYIKLKTIEPAPGAGYGITTGTNGSPVYSRSLSVTTLTATGVVFTNTVSANLFSASTGSIGSVNSSTVTSGSFIKFGGTSSQFLKADGSTDASTYLTSAATSSLVPYSGATGSVNIGSNTMAAQDFSITGTAGAGVLFMRAQAGGTITAGSTIGIKWYSNNAGNLMWKRKPNIGNDTNSRAIVGNITANRNYTLPDKDITFAGLVDIPTYSITGITTPTVYGSAASGGSLTLGSTSNATKGKILFGTSAYDEVNNRLGIGNTSPAYGIDVTGMVQATTGFISNGFNQLSQINGFTNNMGIYGKLSNGAVYLGYNAGLNVTAIFDAGGISVQTGSVSITTVGKGLAIKEGTNGMSGTSTLVGGTVTVANTNIVATSRIFLTGIGTTNAGALTISKNSGVGFTITSTNPLDTRVVDYFIITGN